MKIRFELDPELALREKGTILVCKELLNKGINPTIENIKQNVLDGMDADMMKVIGSHPTFSCGAALSMDSSESFDELYKRVDAALYEAKRQGKNAVHFSL